MENPYATSREKARMLSEPRSSIRTCIENDADPKVVVGQTRALGLQRSVSIAPRLTTIKKSSALICPASA